MLLWSTALVANIYLRCSLSIWQVLLQYARMHIQAWLYFGFSTDPKWKSVCGVLECARNCQIKMYKVSNLSNFSPRLCLIPSICLPLSFAFLCESLFFFLACSLLDFFFFSFSSKCSGWKNKDVKIGPGFFARHLCASVWVFEWAELLTLGWSCCSGWEWQRGRLCLAASSLGSSDKSNRLFQVSAMACLRLGDRSQARFL